MGCKDPRQKAMMELYDDYVEAMFTQNIDYMKLRLEIQKEGDSYLITPVVYEIAQGVTDSVAIEFRHISIRVFKNGDEIIEGRGTLYADDNELKRLQQINLQEYHKRAEIVLYKGNYKEGVRLKQFSINKVPQGAVIHCSVRLLPRLKPYIGYQMLMSPFYIAE